MRSGLTSPSQLQVRSFARMWLPLFCAAVCVSMLWRQSWTSTTLLTGAALVTLLAICTTSEAAARLLFVSLQVVSWPIAVVSSTILLACVFYLVVTPIGLVLRATGRDPLRLRARRRVTHWLPSAEDDDPERAFRQF